jgi:hypothetical protein
MDTCDTWLGVLRYKGKSLNRKKRNIHYLERDILVQTRRDKS